MTPSPPSRGEVWLADLDPTRGREQAGRRPVVVVSDDRYNHGPAELVVALPLTSRRRGVLYHVSVGPPEGGLTLPSDILCDAVRSVSKERLVRCLGKVEAATLEAIEDRLRLLLVL